MVVGDEEAERRLIAALRATAGAVAADGVREDVKPINLSDMFVIDVGQSVGERKSGRRRWLPVAGAAAAVAATVAFAVVLAGSAPQHVEPGSPGQHRSPTPNVPYATTSPPTQPPGHGCGGFLCTTPLVPSGARS